MKKMTFIEFYSKKQNGDFLPILNEQGTLEVTDARLTLKRLVELATKHAERVNNQVHRAKVFDSCRILQGSNNWAAKPISEYIELFKEDQTHEITS